MARIAVVCACGRRLTVGAGRAGTRGRCPACGELMEIPSLAVAGAAVGTPVEAPPGGSGAATGATCAICQTVIEKGEPVRGCAACELPYHTECWSEYGGCAAYGCSKAPKQEKVASDARKECPFCGESIPAKSLRCPSCREHFEDARPVDRETYIRDIVEEPKWKTFRYKALAFLAASVLPCLGPFTLVAGIIWLQNGKKDFERVGGVYKVMVGAGAAMGGLHSLMFILFLAGLAAS